MSFLVKLSMGQETPLYLCRESSGNYNHYWDEDKTKAVSFGNCLRIPEVGLDISDADWVDNNGVVHGPIF